VTVSFWPGLLRLARMRFLLYNLLPVALGVAASVHEGHGFQVGWYVFAQLFAWTVHVMTHFCNEYFDLEADRENVYYTAWTGGSRALVDGLVPPSMALSAAFVTLSAATAMVAVMPTWPARVVAVITVLLAWFYTSPPLKLNYRGMGEITVAAILNGLWPVLAAILQAGTVPVMLLVTLLPTAVLQAARMMVMNLGDRRSDASVGKRTLPVIIGYERAVIVIVSAQPLAYATLTVFAVFGWVPWVVWVPMAATAALSVWLVRQLRAGAMRDLQPDRMTPVVFWASNHVSLIVAGAALGVVVDSVVRGRSSVAAIVVLAGVLGAYAALFAFRLTLARRPVLAAGSPS
jgi:1,4-dihydroxy-2-naphthoate octaprenyltransferase